MQPHHLSKLSRDERLRREAKNCLAIAVRETDCDMAAQLIDEALRLSTRARELQEKAEKQTARATENQRPLIPA